MRPGMFIGLLIGFILAILPALIIIFSRAISGKSKVFWVIAILVIPYVLKIVATFIVIIVQGNALPYGLGPVIPLTWYISAWAGYVVFRKKHPKVATST